MGDAQPLMCCRDKAPKGIIAVRTVIITARGIDMINTVQIIAEEMDHIPIAQTRRILSAILIKIFLGIVIVIKAGRAVLFRIKGFIMTVEIVVVIIGIVGFWIANMAQIAIGPIGVAVNGLIRRAIGGICRADLVCQIVSIA